jgi:hypothetical protein
MAVRRFLTTSTLCAAVPLPDVSGLADDLGLT